MGIYLPLTPLFELDPPADGELRRRSVGQVILGARVGIGVSRHVALELGAGFSPTLVAVERETSTIDVASRLLLLNARAAYSFQPSSSWSFFLAPGFGLIARSGRAWKAISGTTDPAFTLGLGFSSRIDPSRVRIRVEIEDFISWAQFDGTRGGQTESHLHQDLTFSLAIQVPLAGG